MKDSKQDLQAKKHDMSVRSMYFSRYLMIRYFSAAYLFTNMFWLIFAFAYKAPVGTIIAGVLFLMLIAASIEQAAKWHRKDSDLRYTKMYYLVQLVANVVLAVMCYSPFGKTFFPFMTTKNVSNVIFTILVIGILGCILVLRRISNIQHGRDRYLRAIQTFEKNGQ